jgi:2,4-dienoyl-CoA reductase-like NADH-dependent reductase (Old Yellow Enzyme family)
MQDHGDGLSRRRFVATGAGAAAATVVCSLTGRRVLAADSRESYTAFSEGRIAGMTVKNRLVRSATADPVDREGKIRDAVVNMYRDLAAGGVGLIITGHMAVLAKGRAGATQGRIWDDEHISDVARLADAAHGVANGAKIVAQITHCGRQTQYSEMVGPSAVFSPALKKPTRELSAGEIEGIVEAFGAAIPRVQEAGFDGVQFHGAHGWLLSSFLSPYTNRREDKWGGSATNRARIIAEAVALARPKVGPDFPIMIKMNTADLVEGGLDISNFPEQARAVEAAGVDAIECSSGMWDCLVRTEEELGFPPIPLPESRTEIYDDPARQSYNGERAEKAEVKVPLMLNGGNVDIELLEPILKRGKIEYMSFCRAFLRERDFPHRWLEGRGGDKVTCISCNVCLRKGSKDPRKYKTCPLDWEEA